MNINIIIELMKSFYRITNLIGIFKFKILNENGNNIIS